MPSFLSPPELSKSLVAIGETKAAQSAMKLIVLGVLAGAFIGFAAHFATIAGTGWSIRGEPVFFGLKKTVVGAVFTVGLMLVIIPGSELWTGNNLMAVALLEKRITMAGMWRNWLYVYGGNLFGSVMLAWFIASMSGLLDGSVGASAINIAYGKVTDAPQGIDHNVACFFRAICCNWLVCLAVMMAIAAKDIGGKILGIFFPIMAFVASGFEHAIANMYFLPAGIFAKRFDRAVVESKAGAAAIEEAVQSGTLASDVSMELKAEFAREALGPLNWATMWTENLAVVTFGNLVGGVLFVAVVYWFVYVRNSGERGASAP